MLPSKKTPSDFPFRHSGNPDKYGQSLGGNFAQVQANFDKRAEYNQIQINAILDALVSTTDGDSGANNVAITAILGITGGNVQEALESIKTYIDTTVNGIVFGQIPDGSLTNVKLSSDIKIGSLASLLTTIKTSVVDSINEVFQMFANYMAKAGGAFTGWVSFARNEVRQANLKDYSEVLTTITGASGTVNIDLSLGNNFDVTVSGVANLNFQNLPTDSTIAYSFTIALTQPATAQAITYPAIVQWSNSTPPTLDANKTHILTFVKFKNASRLFGMAATKFTT